MAISLWGGMRVWLSLVALLAAATATGQGPAPGTAPPLFPAGGLISYNSIVTTRASGIAGGVPSTARPTFSHEADFNFTWGVFRDFDLTVLIPVITTRFDITGKAVGGTGLGDSLAIVKYRFYRRDSPRGTTQASVTLGPKLPTGRTNLADANGGLLPASLQPGSGSTDLFLAGNWTYTGLFNIKRLVADEDFHSLLRSKGTQATRLGSDLESRFWLSYRPYESKNVAREWFIGPVLTWLRSQDDRIAGVKMRGSGGDGFLAGLAPYVGVGPRMHLWFGVDWGGVDFPRPFFFPFPRPMPFGI